MEDTIIRIGHGSGGRLTRELVGEIFLKHFDNPVLSLLGDASVFSIDGHKIAFTTDSYVIEPIFFPGGDIGKLAVSGTVNDLCVAGAVPKYMSAGFILEEGFSIDQLEKITRSMAAEARQAGVLIITGDTKVVKRGQCDKIFINTSGIGFISPDRAHISDGSHIEPGDKIIVTGTMGDHSVAVLSVRENLTFDEEILSDVAPLNKLTEVVLKEPRDIHFMRDITRGGLATILAETCETKSFGIEINERNIPMHRGVKSVCELYGFDPLYLANEGKIMMIVKRSSADELLQRISANKLGKDAAIIGEITPDHPGVAVMKSLVGGKRIIDLLSGEMLPRIC